MKSTNYSAGSDRGSSLALAVGGVLAIVMLGGTLPDVVQPMSSQSVLAGAPEDTYGAAVLTLIFFYAPVAAICAALASFVWLRTTRRWKIACALAEIGAVFVGLVAAIITIARYRSILNL